MSRWGKSWVVKLLLLAALCAGGALALSVLFRGYALKAAVPAVFLLVLVPAIAEGGRMGGLVVAAAASVIFAMYLFEPYGSLAVRSAVDQTELSFFGLAAVVVICFSPRAVALRSSDGTVNMSEPLKTWIAVVGYAVVFTALINFLLFVWSSVRY